MKVKSTIKIKYTLAILFLTFSYSAFSQTSNIDSLRQIWRSEVDSIFRFYTKNAFDTLRGLMAEEWSAGVKDIYERVNKCETKREYLYALRYFGALINDVHCAFPDGGIYNRKKIFQEKDTIFPVWVKPWIDGRVFAMQDFSGQVPAYSEIISVNGISAKDLGVRQKNIIPGEKRFVDAWTAYTRGGDPLSWINFANYLFCEKITHPFTVEYIPENETVVRKITLSGMQRKDIDKIYRGDKSNEAPKEGWAFLFSLGKNTVLYNRINDSIGVLKIKMFLGSTILGYIWYGMEDKGFPKKLAKIMKQIKKQGIKHLIIDLRGNPGGSADDV